MIPLLGQDLAKVSTLDRFVRELEAQSPDPIDTLEPDLSSCSDADREAARWGWAFRVIDEYRSATRFTTLLGDLLDMEAPYALLAAVHRLIGDELRHAHLCARFAASFGSLDAMRLELDDLGWKGAPRPRRERALEIVVRELVIGEGESIAMMRCYRRATTDPCAQRVLDLLLTDEARHFATGRHLEDALLTLHPDLAPFHASLEDTLLEDVRAIRAQHRDGARGGPGRAFGVSLCLDEAPPAVP